jgi:hypothetical protein
MPQLTSRQSLQVYISRLLLTLACSGYLARNPHVYHDHGVCAIRLTASTVDELAQAVLDVHERNDHVSVLITRHILASTVPAERSNLLLSLPSDTFVETLTEASGLGTFGSAARAVPRQLYIKVWAF